MARLFTVELFNQYVTGTGMIFSPSEHDELLGRADILVLQIFVSKSDGTTPTITVTVQHSNDGRRMVTHSTPVNGQSIASIPYEAIVSAGSSSDPLGAEVQVGVNLGGTSPEAYIQITATGRSS